MENKEDNEQYEHKNTVIDQEGNEIPLHEIPEPPEGTVLNEEQLREQCKHLNPNPADLYYQFMKEADKINPENNVERKSED
jgi:hypothetical protein